MFLELKQTHKYTLFATFSLIGLSEVAALAVIMLVPFGVDSDRVGKGDIDC